jgi:hypothetical protein
VSLIAQKMAKKGANKQAMGWWCGVDVGVLYIYITAQLEIPREGYDEHGSKSSLSCETKVYRTSRRKNQTSEG